MCLLEIDWLKFLPVFFIKCLNHKKHSDHNRSRGKFQISCEQNEVRRSLNEINWKSGNLFDLLLFYVKFAIFWFLLPELSLKPRHIWMRNLSDWSLGIQRYLMYIHRLQISLHKVAQATPHKGLIRRETKGFLLHIYI